MTEAPFEIASSATSWSAGLGQDLIRRSALRALAASLFAIEDASHRAPKGETADDMTGVKRVGDRTL